MNISETHREREGERERGRERERERGQTEKQKSRFQRGERERGVYKMDVESSANTERDWKMKAGEKQDYYGY